MDIEKIKEATEEFILRTLSNKYASAAELEATTTLVEILLRYGIT